MKKINEIDLGAYEFAPRRIDLNDSERSERDTEAENIIFRTIRDWIDSVIQPQKEEIKLIIDAMSDRKYSNFFRGPRDVNVVYRGLVVKGGQLKRWLGKENDPEFPYNGSAVGDWIMSPRGGEGFVSYTKSKRVPFDFTYRGENSLDSYGVVWAASVPDNKGAFLDVNSMTNLLDSSSFSINTEAEREVIAVKPVKISKIWWWNKGAPHHKQITPTL